MMKPVLQNEQDSQNCQVLTCKFCKSCKSCPFEFEQKGEDARKFFRVT
jgi:hypothetical protein